MGEHKSVGLIIGMTRDGAYFFRMPQEDWDLGGQSYSLDAAVGMVRRNLPRRMRVASVMRDFSQMEGPGFPLLPYQNRIIDLLKKRCDEAICVDGQVHEL